VRHGTRCAVPTDLLLRVLQQIHVRLEGSNQIACCFLPFCAGHWVSDKAMTTSSHKHLKDKKLNRPESLVACWPLAGAVAVGVGAAAGWGVLGAGTGCVVEGRGCCCAGCCGREGLRDPWSVVPTRSWIRQACTKQGLWSTIGLRTISNLGS
jgi:hypothetical protein